MLDQVLRTARERQQTLMLRVAPYGTDKDNDVPDWYRRLVGDESAKGLPAKWRTDPENPLYVKHFSAFVRELGRRYDGHPDLELVDISIVAAWGEGEHTEKLSEPTMRALMDSYLESFTKTPMVAQPTDRRTNRYALSKRNVGWRADCLGDMRCVNGAGWCHMFDLYPQAIINFGIQDAWKTAPVALEACWVMQHWKNQGWDVDYILDQALKWHISSFNNKSSAVPEEWRAKVDQWLKRMGYRFVLRRFSYPAVVRPSGTVGLRELVGEQGCRPLLPAVPAGDPPEERGADRSPVDPRRHSHLAARRRRLRRRGLRSGRHAGGRLRAGDRPRRPANARAQGQARHRRRGRRRMVRPGPRGGEALRRGAAFSLSALSARARRARG